MAYRPRTVKNPYKKLERRIGQPYNLSSIRRDMLFELYGKVKQIKPTVETIEIDRVSISSHLVTIRCTKGFYILLKTSKEMLPPDLNMFY
jgi:hypothetical protein